MRTLKLIEYVTLDGVVEDPGPSGGFKYRGWTIPYWNEEMAEAQSEELFASDALLLGRVTYEDFVAAWPLRSGDAFTDKIFQQGRFHSRRQRRIQNALKGNKALFQANGIPHRAPERHAPATGAAYRQAPAPRVPAVQARDNRSRFWRSMFTFRRLCMGLLS